MAPPSPALTPPGSCPEMLDGTSLAMPTNPLSCLPDRPHFPSLLLGCESLSGQPSGGDWSI